MSYVLGFDGMLRYGIGMIQISRFKLGLTLLVTALMIAAETAQAQIKAPVNNELAGVWVLNKKTNPNPREVLIEAWKTERGHKRGLRAYEEKELIEAMATFLFPYSDWVKLEQFNNGISINYAGGEVREYWTDELNTPEFTGLFGETTTAWLDKQFFIETEFEEEKMLVKEFLNASTENKQLTNTFEIHWKKFSQPVLIKMVYDKKE